MNSSRKLLNMIVTFALSPLAFAASMKSKLEIQVHNPPDIYSTAGENTTTAPMRYPHLYLHLFEGKPSRPVGRVLILGPGLFTTHKSEQRAVPQLHEVQAIYPKAKITIFDKSPEILEFYKESSYQCVRHMAGLISSHPENFNADGEDLVRARMKRVKSFTQTISNQLNLKKIGMINGDFEDFSQLPEQVDLIFATASLVYAISNLNNLGKHEELTQMMQNILSSLSIGGRFYIEEQTIRNLKKINVLTKNVQDELVFGDDTMRFGTLKIPAHSSFIPEKHRGSAILKQKYIILGKTDGDNISTSDLVELTRIR